VTVDYRDVFILMHMNAAGIAGAAFMFAHPDAINFATWAGLIATLTSAYKWFVFKSSKETDAGA
jgi:hypothetical protein